MNSDQLDDLKQFISASISQSEERMRQEMQGMRQEMSDGFKEVRQEMADGFLGVGQAIDEIHQQLEAQNAKYEAVDKRLTKLERQVAS